MLGARVNEHVTVVEAAASLAVWRGTARNRNDPEAQRVRERLLNVQRASICEFYFNGRQTLETYQAKKSFDLDSKC